jgi:hypothetical protein
MVPFQAEASTALLLDFSGILASLNMRNSTPHYTKNQLYAIITYVIRLIVL